LISQLRGQSEKALNYAQKALKLDALDPTLQQQLLSLQHLQGNAELEPALQAVAVEQNAPELAIAGHTHHAQNVPQTIHTYSAFSEANDQQAIVERNPWEELKKMMHSNQRAQHFPIEATSSSALERCIQQFQDDQINQMQDYLQNAESHSQLQNDALYILNGWNHRHSKNTFLFTEESRKSFGGHYLRWQGKGIAINPGPHFLDHFHAQGLCIRDIDFVIVSRNSPEAYADVKAISELNQQLNQTSPDRQIIHYYLHQRVCQELAPFLKPSFKQARNTIHKLEMFLDSPDVEKIELEDGITLHYFLTTMPDTLPHYRENVQDLHFNRSNFGIRLELANETKQLKIGYLSGLAWSPLLAHHLGHCDLLLAAFGNTSPTDYSRLGYNDESLGFSGMATLLEELAPRLLLLTEFGGREGDIRIEVTKKLRAECQASPSTVLPADIGLIVNLDALNVKCSISDEIVATQNIAVCASRDRFGRLKYLSPHFCA